MEVLEAKVGNLRYQDEVSTNLSTIDREVTELLIEVGVPDMAVLVEAALRYLPYTEKIWRENNFNEV